MKKELLFGGVGLLVGAIIIGAIATTAVNNNDRNVMQMMGMKTTQPALTPSGHMNMTMNEMQEELKNKKGDAFDKEFTSMMIAHHQGAVNMAKYAQQSAKHIEIKKMADDIISAQTKEIQMMEKWRAQWGYTPTAHGHNHDQD